MNMIYALLGIYIVFEAVLAAEPANAEAKWCTAAKYTLAFVYGLLLVFGERIPSYFQISTHSREILGAFALTLALWPSTFYRAMKWLQFHMPRLYKKLEAKFNSDRRES